MIKSLDNAKRAGKLPEALEKLLPALISNLTRHLPHSAGGAGEPHTPEEGQARSSPPHALASLARPLPASGVLSQAWLLPAPRQLLVATLSAVTALSAEYKTDFATSAAALLPILLNLADSRARHPYSTLRPPPRRPALAKLAWRLRLVYRPPQARRAPEGSARWPRSTWPPSCPRPASSRSSPTFSPSSPTRRTPAHVPRAGKSWQVCTKALGGAIAVPRPDGLPMHVYACPPFATHAGVAAILSSVVFLEMLPEHLATIGELLRKYLLDFSETSGAGCDVRLPLGA